MFYRFTIINTYWAFVKESESEVSCTDPTALASSPVFYAVLREREQLAFMNWEPISRNSSGAQTPGLYIWRRASISQYVCFWK
jgi:hypothetical protein